MRIRIVSAIILLAVGLCFVPSLGYGEVIIPAQATVVGEVLTGATDEPLWPYIEGLREDIGFLRLQNNLLKARIDYMMRNPTEFQNIYIFYDRTGGLKEYFPENIDTKGKICILIEDIRGYFSDTPDMSELALKEAFKAYLGVVYSYIEEWATDIDTDVVAKFTSRGEIPLGYFYQGEYHLWEK